MVAPGIAITASHIFSQILDDLQKGAIVPYCWGIRETSLEMWRVTSLSHNDSTDIAVLSMTAASKLSEGGQYFRMGITTRTPKEGEKLHILGFRSTTFVDEPKDVQFAGHLYTSVGVVAAVYPNGRDRVLMPYPV